jgi:hypothetical protein
MRFVVLLVAVLFVIAMALLTVTDFATYGVTGLGVVGAIVVVIMGVGIIGAFLTPPRR